MFLIIPARWVSALAGPALIGALLVVPLMVLTMFISAGLVYLWPIVLVIWAGMRIVARTRTKHIRAAARDAEIACAAARTSLEQLQTAVKLVRDDPGLAVPGRITGEMEYEATCGAAARAQEAANRASEKASKLRMKSAAAIATKAYTAAKEARGAASEAASIYRSERLRSTHRAAKRLLGSPVQAAIRFVHRTQGGG